MKALSSPIFGTVSDKYVSHSKGLVLFSTGLFVMSHVQFFMLRTGTQQLPNYFSIFGLVTLGLAFSSYSAITLPVFQSLIPERYFGTALDIRF
jgi:hypothetical protein